MPLQTDTWVPATWEDFSAAMDAPQYAEGRGYLDHGYMRVEMSPLGAGHGRQNSVISNVVNLFGLVRGLRLVGFTNCSFYQPGERGCQPDLAVYVGDTVSLPPQDNSPIDINRYGPPTLVVEVGASSFKDDLGAKRLLYERLGVTEYWVVDVTERRVIAFAMDAGRSGEIAQSEVLPGLSMALVEEALHRSQTEDDGTLMRWLMTTFGDMVQGE
jgi:Uma2 family endonuclease